MTDVNRSEFNYVTFIKTTPEKLWTALTSAEFTKQYFFGVVFDTDWKKGSPWKMVHPDGRISDAACPEVADRIHARAESGGLFTLRDVARTGAGHGQADHQPFD
jgi:hypothetical protein